MSPAVTAALAASRRVIAAHPDAVALFLIIVIGAVLRIAFFPRAPVFIHGDSGQYWEPARALLAGQGLDIPLKRPPVYPLLLALIGGTMGENLLNVLALQHLLGLGIVATVYGIGLLTIGRPAAIIGGLVAAVSGNLLLYEHYLMTETVFTLFLSAAILFYLLGLRRDSAGWYVASGLAVGLASLTRPHAQILLVVGPPIVALVWQRRRPVIRAVVAATVPAVLVMLPWMIRNYVEYGAFTVAGALGQNMIMQTVSFHNGSYVFWDTQNPPSDPNPQRRWARKYVQDRADDKAEKPWLDTITGIGIHGRLMHELNIGEAEADRLMQQIATEAILARPLTYLRLWFEDSRMILMGAPEELGFHWQLRESRKWPKESAYLIPPPTPEQERGFPLTEGMLNLYQGARLGPLVPALFLVGIVASWLTPMWRPALLLALTVLALSTASAATVGFVNRYHHPGDPLMHVVAVGGVLFIGRRMMELVQRRGDAPLSPPRPRMAARSEGSSLVR